MLNNLTAMTWLSWLGIVLGASVVIAMALRVVGGARWAALVRTHTSLLESGREKTQRSPPSPKRFDVHELEGLPPPVQRYFRAVLIDQQPIIAAVTIEMTGTMNMSETAEQWKPFRSLQRVVTRRPGFLWNARIAVFPGVTAYVEDSYIDGLGRLLARVFGVFTIADSHGDGEIARGELMRYFAEAAWYPTALLPSQGVRWDVVDDRSAHATLVDGALTLTMLFRFNSAGLMASVHTEARGASVGKDGLMVMLPWDCSLSDYRKQDGMLIPMTGEAAWMRTVGRKTYFHGCVRKLC